MSEIEVELQDTMGSDEAIANAAWTSTYNKQRREGKYDDPRKVEDIVTRCVRSGHSVPLESVVLRFWFRWPVYVDRQHMTHRIASHNGLSGRYRTVPEDFISPPADVMDVLNKLPSDGRDLHPADRVWREYIQMCSLCHVKYKEHLNLLRGAEREDLITNAEYKRAREFLRGMVPTAFMVERTTIMNLLSFANWQRLRNSDHAQPEIRQAAQKALALVLEKGVAPVALRELMAVGWTTAKANHEFKIAALSL